MPTKKSQSLLSSYRKKNRNNKLALIILVAVLIIAGITLMILWATGTIGGGGGIKLFSTKTPTPTLTFTPTPVTPTNTPTITPTATETPTITPTPTPDGPMPYIVQKDDYYCAGIAEKFGVELEVFLMVNNKTADNCLIHEGDTVLIPPAWMKMPTSTPFEATMVVPGTIIDYIVESGANLPSVAKFFYSTVDRIVQETNIYNRANKLPEITATTPLRIGQLLRVPANIATPIPTATATRTVTPAKP